MARPLRLEFPGATNPVTARGDLREPICRDDADRLTHLQLIGAAMGRLNTSGGPGCRSGGWAG
jgi:hypothetical protein